MVSAESTNTDSAAATAVPTVGSNRIFNKISYNESFLNQRGLSDYCVIEIGLPLYKVI